MTDMKTYKGFKVGQRVTVKKPDEAYDKLGTIEPGEPGTIKAFPPKVRIVKGEVFDGLPYFAYVEFDRVDETHPPHRNCIRGGIDICNLMKV